VDDEARIAEFKKEFNALMQKHRAQMWPTCEGDTHGIYEEAIECALKRPDKSKNGFNSWGRTFRLWEEGEQV